MDEIKHWETIKVATIGKYLAAAASFIRLFAFGMSYRDPRKLSPTDTNFALPISKTLDEIKHWETMSDLCNPFTLEMMALLKTRAKLAPQDSGVEALADWCKIGLHGPKAQ